MSMSLALLAMPSSRIFAAFVDQRIHQPVHDLVVADLARRDAQRGAVLFDHLPTTVDGIASRLPGW
jgi:hypothetical protein